MNYPDCHDKRADCRFVNHGGTSTLVHSPLIYDRQGNPVGGGNNTHQTTVECLTCSRRWWSIATELQIIKGEPKVWNRL